VFKRQPSKIDSSLSERKTKEKAKKKDVALAQTLTKIPILGFLPNRILPFLLPNISSATRNWTLLDIADPFFILQFHL
jgi:hypothetical protein